MNMNKTIYTDNYLSRGHSHVNNLNPFSPQEVELKGALLESTPPKGKDWIFEIKYDGYRIMAYIELGKCTLISRGGKDYSHKFGQVVRELKELSHNRAIVLDGEMVVMDSRGVTDFQAMQNFIKSRHGTQPMFMVFDILALDGNDLRDLELLERHRILADLLQNVEGTSIRYGGYIESNGQDCWQAACGLGLEGIVAKKTHSTYHGYKNGDWIKIKCGRRQEFVIGGFTVSDKQTLGLSSILLGVFEGEQFVYCGRAGTGMTEQERTELAAKLTPLKTNQAAFDNPPKVRSGERIVWVKPRLVAEIVYAGWTDSGLLRQASYKGLRTDKQANEVIREDAKMDNVDNLKPTKRSSRLNDTVGTDLLKSKSKRIVKEDSDIVNGVKITSPEKVIFEPDITKIEVVEYYSAMAKYMLPFAGNRILSIVRCPRGAAEVCFYKKHPDAKAKGVVTIPVVNSEGETDDYFYIQDARGFVEEAQMGTLEFHTWGSRADNMDSPDIMVFDLDPDEGMELAQVRQGVRDLKSVLDGLGLKSFLKTSGGKGYHIVVPFEPLVGWDKFRLFAKGVAEVMERQWPDRYTVNMRKEKRKGKIFIDWVRNGRGATSVAPYSLRARAGAKVSMPIKWSDLDSVAPDDIDMFKAMELVKSSPWRGFEQARAIFRG